MLTYELKKAPGVPLYEALYRCIRGDILSGVLQAGMKLPSKRGLSTHLKVSKITVETAYDQLLQEGYIRSVEKVGYFVETLGQVPPAVPVPAAPPEPEAPLLDLTAGAAAGHFPFSVWSRLQREVMQDLGHQLLQPLPNQGLWQLRQAIAGHLAQFRGMHVSADHILIGAGTDFLYNLLVQLLGADKRYAVEEPGYGKIRRIYAAAGAQCMDAPMDSQGVIPQALAEAQVLHSSVSHHFPTGLVTPMSRRQALLRWLGQREDRFIIEDDYDTEFRFAAHPMPAMYSLDSSGRVIYMNTFSRSLAPSIRISYMVLPPALMEAFREKLGFYSCTVSSFEQYTLTRFLEQGAFEKHINRMRKYYRARRNRVLSAIEGCPFADRLTIREENAGLHFLLAVDTDLPEESLVQRCREAGIRVRTLASYYHGQVPESARRCLVVNYAGLTDAQLDVLPALLAKM